MADIRELHGLPDPALDVFARLTENQLRSRRDETRGICIVESPAAVSAALDAGFQPLSLLMERRCIGGSGREILSRCPDVPVYTGDRELLSQLTGYELTRGVLGAFRRPVLPGLETVCSGARRIAVLDGLTDPSNVGALFRCAAALGMDGVLVTPSCCDPLHRRAVRVSMGSVFQIPWTRLGQDGASWPGEEIPRLRSLGLPLCAMALDDRAVPLGDPRLKELPRLAVVIGSEWNGLPPETAALCDWTVRIPMHRGVNSLNAAAAGAVAFWELRVREDL